MSRHTILFLLFLGYILLINTPVLLAWFSDLPPRPFQDEMASALALLGMTMILLEFVLSGRFRRLSAPIGIDIIMRSHQLLGRIIVILIFFHPILYSLPSNYLLPWDTFHTQTTRLDMLDTITGISAWIGLAIVVFMAVMRESLHTRYEHWRLTHLVISVITTMLVLTHAMGAGRYTEFAGLEIIWFSLAVLAILSLIHVYIAVPLQQQSHAYLIDSVSAVANRSWRLVLKPESGPLMNYLAGQFVWLKFTGPFWSLQEHPFSISSAPVNREYLEFTLKEFGDFSAKINTLQTGSKVYIDGPHGHFTVDNRQARGIMLIAGGVGIAPVISILRQLAGEGFKYPVVLISCNTTTSDLAYRAEIDALPSRLDIRCTHMVSGDVENSNCLKGRLSHQVIAEQLPDKADSWLYFVCGPVGMMDAAEHSLLELGVPLKQIVTERFQYAARSGSRRSRYILYTIMAVCTISLAFIVAFSLR